MITIVGGTGRLGRLVAGRLVADGHDVRVVSRSAPRDPVSSAEFVAADVRDPTTLPAAVAGSDVVVSAMHGMDPQAGQSPAEVDRDGNRNLIRAARAAGADIVLLSVIGASGNHPMELFRMKAQAEDELTSGSDDWTIVRASAFAEGWAEIVRSTASGGGAPKVFGKGENPINFVTVQDVASAVVHAATDRSLRGSVIEVGGPDNLTMTQFARLVTGQPRQGHIPRTALRVAGAALAPIRPAQARLMRAALVMDTEDLRFDPGASRAAYPWLTCTPLTEAFLTGT